MVKKAAKRPATKPKPAPKRAAAPAKPVPKKPAAASKPAPKASAKPVATPKPAAKAPPAPVKGAKAASPPAPDAKKPGRKGITIVTPKPAAPPAPAAKKGKTKVSISIIPANAGRLLDPKNPIRKPLIPSGPKAAHMRPLGSHAPEHENSENKPAIKTPFGKKELAHFRAILVRKRAELIGDVSQMETEALKGQSGSLSSLPQHLADQGSDTYDQSLALNLAAADRKLIREIDDAIKRIDDGTYGVCEVTGKPIKAERLEELPWARYSIEAARELERRNMWAN